MDIWSCVAEYVLVQNPTCQAKKGGKRAGSVLACASTMHKQAVGLALFRNRYTFVFCTRPLHLTQDQALFWTSGPHPDSYQFCKDCPDSFEMWDDRGPEAIHRIAEICPCLSRTAIHERLFRFTYCLAEVQMGECPDCEAANYVSGRTVVELMHHEDCGGCLEAIPSVCRECHCIFL